MNDEPTPGPKATARDKTRLRWTPWTFASLSLLAAAAAGVIFTLGSIRGLERRVQAAERHAAQAKKLALELRVDLRNHEIESEDHADERTKNAALPEKFARAREDLRKTLREAEAARRLAKERGRKFEVENQELQKANQAIAEELLGASVLPEAHRHVQDLLRSQGLWTNIHDVEPSRIFQRVSAGLGTSGSVVVEGQFQVDTPTGGRRTQGYWLPMVSDEAGDWHPASSGPIWRNAPLSKAAEVAEALARRDLVKQGRSTRIEVLVPAELVNLSDSLKEVTAAGTFQTWDEAGAARLQGYTVKLTRTAEDSWKPLNPRPLWNE